MNLNTWLVFCATETALCFMPGPAVLFVISVALAVRARAKWIERTGGGCLLAAGMRLALVKP